VLRAQKELVKVPRTVRPVLNYKGVTGLVVGAMQNGAGCASFEPNLPFVSAVAISHFGYVQVAIYPCQVVGNLPCRQRP
jgi:hypothetical protein